MLHFAVDPDALQREVPFPIERHDGQAFISLVCFTLTDMRPSLGGGLAAALFRPWGTHRYLNVRTYVRHAEESGIYFLAEWLSSRIATRFGPVLFSLPFRFGKMDYANGCAVDGVRGRVAAHDGVLAYRSHSPVCDDAHPTVALPGSLDEFLLERYTAFTARRGRRGFFRVWHPPWPAQRVNCQVTERSLLTENWPWFAAAKLVMAHHSRGFAKVWMGWPHRLADGHARALGPACPIVGRSA